MEVYSYEGKKANEVFEKALSDLNVTEDEILYHKQINKGGFLKSDTVKFTIVKLTEVQNSIKSFLEETINNMGLEVKFETNIREKQINIKIFSNIFNVTFLSRIFSIISLYSCTGELHVLASLSL